MKKPSSLGAAIKAAVTGLTLAGVLLFFGIRWYKTDVTPKADPKPVAVTPKPVAPIVPPEPEPEPVKPALPRLPPAASTVLQVRLLQGVGTKESKSGDPFTGRIDSGVYAGGSVSGRLLEVERGRKESRVGFQFEALIYRGVRYPFRAELRSVATPKGAVKEAEEENTVANKSPSKKRVAILGAVGGAIGGAIGKIKGGNKTAVVAGAAAGTGAGVVAGLTVASKAGDVNLPAGTTLTIVALTVGR
jgi:hypothetical protein